MEPEAIKVLSVAAILLSTATTAFTIFFHLDMSQHRDRFPINHPIPNQPSPDSQRPQSSPQPIEQPMGGAFESLQRKLVETEVKWKQANDELWDRKQEVEQFKTQITQAQQQMQQMDQQIQSITLQNQQLQQYQASLEADLLTFQQCAKDTRDVFNAIFDFNPIQVARRIEIGGEILELVQNTVNEDGTCRRAWDLLNQEGQTFQVRHSKPVS